MAARKQIAREIFRDTLTSLDIPRVMQRKLELAGSQLTIEKRNIDLAAHSSVVVIAIGKAAHPMVAGLISILPSSIPITGIVAAPTPPLRPLPNFRYFIGGHPIPNEDSWNSAKTTLELLQSIPPRTLVVFLLSGGGSALSELPLVPGMALDDLRAVNQALVTCGAPIDAMNTVRRHLSAIKGGRLAVAAGGATQITLAVTDVPEGHEHALASGPTLPDPTTTSDVLKIVQEYSLREKFPPVVSRWLDSAQFSETPKPGHPAFQHASFHLLLGMHDLFHTAHLCAEAHGYSCLCDNSTDDWPVEKASNALLNKLQEWRKENPGRRVALIADGEVSSPVTGKGIGGRNSAFVLSCVEAISGMHITVLSAGTDGMDGNSPAAGAVADGQTLDRGRAHQLEPSASFRESDAYTYFHTLGDAILTGPTGNNLRDLRILLAEP